MAAHDTIRLNNDLVAIPNLRNQLRKLRWFASAFKVHACLVEEEINVTYRIDDFLLSRAFFDWIDSLRLHRHGVDINFHDFVAFAAGLSLGGLVRHSPATVVTTTDKPLRLATGSDDTRTAHDLWPEGFLYVNFCLSVIAALEEQEFGSVKSTVHADANDLVFWGSFWENTSQASRLAVPFLDSMLGKQPNWDLPMNVNARPAMQQALSAGSQS